MSIASCRVVSLELRRIVGKAAGAASLAAALQEINAHARLKQSFIRTLLLILVILIYRLLKCMCLQVRRHSEYANRGVMCMMQDVTSSKSTAATEQTVI